MLFICLIPALASAQTAPAPPPSDKISHWGFDVSFTPEWKIPSFITQKIADQGGTLVAQGSQFTLGIVHGRATGGDWGISFVREPVKDGSNGHGNDSECYSNGCFDTSTHYVTQGVYLIGVQVHTFKPFKTFRRRVQIGIELGGGVGQIKGNLAETENNVTTTVNPQTGMVVGTPTSTSVTKPVSDEIDFKVIPLAHLEAVVAFIASPAVKIRWQGGIVMPGVTAFNVTATVLFGAR